MLPQVIRGAGLERPPPASHEVLAVIGDGSTPSTSDDANLLTSWISRQVRIRGLRNSPELNGVLGQVLEYDVPSSRYLLQTSEKHGHKIVKIKPNNLEVVSDAEIKSREATWFDPVELAKSLAAERQTHKSSKSKKSSSSNNLCPRNGVPRGTCPCCNEQMSEQEGEGYFPIGVGGTVRVLSDFELSQGLDGSKLHEMTEMVVNECVAYGQMSLSDCDCKDWVSQYMATHSIAEENKWPTTQCKKDYEIRMCSHQGNNPLQFPLPEILASGIAEAALNIAWRDDDVTRFDAVRLLMCYALCCPPPSYVFSYDFQQVARQVAAVLSAGKSDVSQAAAQASISLLWCACTSRPIDLCVQDGLGNAIAPYEESAARGTYRVDFQRLAPYAHPSGIDKGVTFNDFHDRIMNFKASCETCGKKQVKGGKKILNKCSRCFQCFYCSKDCQREHWKKKGGGGGHKAACLELKALYQKNKEMRWQPGMDKFMCGRCGFGPVDNVDLDRHVELTGHQRNAGLVNPDTGECSETTSPDAVRYVVVKYDPREQLAMYCLVYMRMRQEEEAEAAVVGAGEGEREQQQQQRLPFLGTFAEMQYYDEADGTDVSVSELVGYIREVHAKVVERTDGNYFSAEAEAGITVGGMTQVLVGLCEKGIILPCEICTEFNQDVDAEEEDDEEEDMLNVVASTCFYSRVGRDFVDLSYRNMMNDGDTRARIAKEGRMLEYRKTWDEYFRR